MDVVPIEDVIPESHIVVFAPHYDDFLLGLGSYVLELQARGLLESKQFHILLLFSRSNYQAGSGPANFDTRLERIKLATGNRVVEDMQCLDELLGAHNYRYELLREKECFVRAKPFAESEMEFPHGAYQDFDEEDRQIFARMQKLVETWAIREETALVFPLAIKEHIDHFITREAGITTAFKLGSQARARFYFQEDKPYAGIQTPDEETRVEHFIRSNRLKACLYRGHSERVIELAFKHYVSQVEEVYRKGIQQRSRQLMEQYHLSEDCDQIYKLPSSA
jgi:hypothetical protein